MFEIPAEKKFENQIKRYFHSVGIYPAGYPENKMNAPITGWYIKYWAGAQFTKSGVPDILACINGHFVAVEVKAADGTPSDLQILNCKRINAGRGLAFVLYPSAFDEFKELVNSIVQDNRYWTRSSIPLVWK